MDKLKAIMRWLIVALILAAVSCVVLILTRPPLRETAVRQIAELTGAKVRAGLVDFNLDGSVVIKNLEISPGERKEYANTILKAESVYAEFGIGGLFSPRPRLKEITIQDFVFSAQCDLDTGEWNLAAIKTRPSKAGGGEAPVVRLERGRLRYSKVSGGQVEMVTEVPVEALLTPSKQTPGGYSFDITMAETAGAGGSSLSGLWQPGKVRVSGKNSSVDVPVFERVWTVGALDADLDYDRYSNFSLKLSAKDLVGNQASTPSSSSNGADSLDNSGLFHALETFFERFRATGRIDIELNAWGNLDRLSESKLVGKVACKDVSICDRTFPYTMEHLTGPIDLTENSAVLNELSAEHGEVKLAVDGWSRKAGANWQYEVGLASDNMLLDNDLYDALNAKNRSFWDSFSPTGKASIDYRLTQKSPADSNSILTVELMGVDAAYVEFPYPLRDLTGKLVFKRQSVKFSELVSEYGGRMIALNGRVLDQHTDRPIYDIVVKATDIPLDSMLTEVLPASQKHFCDQFDMTGLADAEIKIYTPSLNADSATYSAAVSFQDASLKTKESPLAISEMSAKAVFAPGAIRLERLRGRYGEGLVSITGDIWPEVDEKKSRYCLSVEAERIELNDEVLSLLPPSLHECFHDMQPRGKVNLSGRLNNAGREECADQKLVVECLGNSAGLRLARRLQGESPISAETSSYPLRDITGRLTVTEDAVTLEDITARPGTDANEAAGTATIKLNGKVTLTDNAFAGGRFQLQAEDVSFDYRLRYALPEGIGDYYSSLSAAGRFDLDLNDIEINYDTDANAVERSIDFAGTARFKGCDFNVCGGITGLDGVLTAQGRYASGQGFLDGQAALSADRLGIKGKSFTDLQTQLSYDRDKKRWISTRLIADWYGGRMAGELELGRASEGTLGYLLQVGFDEIDLRQFLADRNRWSPASDRESSANGHTTGQMRGSLSIDALAGGDGPCVGRCRLSISDMQVGKLSPLARLLYVLKLTEPKDFAFDRMVVDSYIRDDKLFIQRFDLSGKALAFQGAGSMDLQTQNVDLVLGVRGDRLAAAEPSIVQSLAEGLGQAVLRMEVTGNIYEPHVQVKTLPLLGDSLSILGKGH